MNFFQRDMNRGLRLIHVSRSSSPTPNLGNEHDEISADAKYIVKHVYIVFFLLSLLSLALRAW